METVTSADGTEIAYERTGSGDPLVLVHAGMCTRHFWDPLKPHLADEFELVIPDRRGRGASGDAGAYSLAREVADVRAVVDALDGVPSVFGFSFGGLCALEAARDGGIDRLVLFEPAVLVGEYREQASLADRMQARIDGGDREGALKLFLRTVGDVEDVDALVAGMPQWPACLDWAETVVRENRAIEEYELDRPLDVDVPGLLLTGTDGPRHLRESVRAVHRALPDSRLVEFEDMAHGGALQQSDRLAPEIRAFLTEGRTA